MDLGTNFQDNSAGGFGGAMAVTWYTSVVMTDPVFINNTSADDGGALYVDKSYVEMTNSEFDHNTVYSNRGRDIYINDDDDPNGGGGSYVNCANGDDGNNYSTFCDGTSGISEAGTDFSNTNC
jgi:hypothetical protein